MIAPKTQTLQKKADANSKSVVGMTMMPDTMPTNDKIQKRAYELYESRGREPGQDEQDWLRAEQEVLQKKQ